MVFSFNIFELMRQSRGTTMKAMLLKRGLFSSDLHLVEVRTPQIKDDEVLITVCAAGVNADDDLLHTRGNNIICPGLECSGIISGVGKNVQRWKIGDRVCAILTGGGYAEKVSVRADLVLSVPDTVSLEDAATLPYATCSLWVALFKSHKKESLEGKKILINEGASKFGLLAIQFAKYKGLKVIAVTESNENFAICHKHGADACINRTTGDYGSLAMKEHGGVDFVVDYGGHQPYRNLCCCKFMGEVALFDFRGLGQNNIDITAFIARNIKLNVISLQRKNLDFLASTIAEVRAHMWPAIEDKKVVPSVYTRLPMEEALIAYERLEKKEKYARVILLNDFKNVS